MINGKKDFDGHSHHPLRLRVTSLSFPSRACDEGAVDVHAAGGEIKPDNRGGRAGIEGVGVGVDNLPVLREEEAAAEVGGPEGCHIPVVRVALEREDQFICLTAHPAEHDFGGRGLQFIPVARHRESVIPVVRVVAGYVQGCVPGSQTTGREPDGKGRCLAGVD